MSTAGNHSSCSGPNPAHLTLYRSNFDLGSYFVIKDVLDKIHVCILWRLRYSSGEYFEPFPIHVAMECAARFVHQGVSSFSIQCCETVDALVGWFVFCSWPYSLGRGARPECHMAGFFSPVETIGCVLGRIDICQGLPLLCHPV